VHVRVEVGQVARSSPSVCTNRISPGRAPGAAWAYAASSNRAAIRHSSPSHARCRPNTGRSSRGTVNTYWRCATGASAFASDAYVRAIVGATPMEIVEIERKGLSGAFIKELSRNMEVATSRTFAILGVPKATAEKKAAAGERISGSGGQAAVGLIRLLWIAQDIVRHSSRGEGFRRGQVAWSVDRAATAGPWRSQTCRSDRHTHWCGDSGLLEINVRDDVWVLTEELDVTFLPPTWSAIPAGQASVKIGSDWLTALRPPILLVPSVIVAKNALCW